MGYIDEKFKETSPAETAERIRGILHGIGVTLEEKWFESGIENCWSLIASTKEGFPFTCGKGVTKEFARASGYAEYMERLQSGLFFYKFQSLERDPELDLQAYAPDGRYMTKDELIENGEWMDYLIQTYGGNLSRQTLAEQCRMYAHSEDGRILTVPYYSLFENKYVYLPTGFAEMIYSANGCCVGNTKEEALVHALSEIMERKGSIAMLTSGAGMPEIPEQTLQRFDTVAKILNRIRQNPDLDVKVFDCSVGNGFPVVAARIINKQTHNYVVNVAADPVLEIAIQRTLTETFQGRNVDRFVSHHSGRILNKITDIPVVSNVLNQLETASGVYTADFFAEELTCSRKCTEFEDNSGLTNSQLVQKLLRLYRAINKPLYIRNYAFLGFPCYKVIVPGFSESRGLKLNDPFPEYAVGHMVSKTLRNAASATDEDLKWVISFRKRIANAISRVNSFDKLSGIPLSAQASGMLLYVTLAYAFYRLNNIGETLKYLERLSSLQTISQEERQYFACVKQYLELKSSGVSEEKILCIIKKFYREETAAALQKALANGSFFDAYLLRCDPASCGTCRYQECCSYQSAKQIIRNAGSEYRKFKHGQAPENFVKLEDGSL